MCPAGMCCTSAMSFISWFSVSFSFLHIFFSLLSYLIPFSDISFSLSLFTSFLRRFLLLYFYLPLLFFVFTVFSGVIFFSFSFSIFIYISTFVFFPRLIIVLYFITISVNTSSVLSFFPVHNFLLLFLSPFFSYFNFSFIFRMVSCIIFHSNSFFSFIFLTSCLIPILSLVPFSFTCLTTNFLFFIFYNVSFFLSFTV